MRQKRSILCRDCGERHEVGVLERPNKGGRGVVGAEDYARCPKTGREYDEAEIEMMLIEQGELVG